MLWLWIVVGLAKLWLLVLESEELDKHIMVLLSLFGTLCTVEQWWQKAYTLDNDLSIEYWLLCPLYWSILNMYLYTLQKYWERQLDDLDNKQDMLGAMAIKWVHQSKWPTYYSCHNCIDALKNYNYVARIQMTLYCNMA